MGGNQIILENHLLLPSGFLLGKENQGQASAPLLPTTPASALSPPAPTTSASSTHAKTGSKDSSTQTDKSTELFWPSMASLPSRGRLSTAPSNSPILKHPTAKGTVEKLGMRAPLLPRMETPWLEGGDLQLSCREIRKPSQLLCFSGGCHFRLCC